MRRATSITKTLICLGLALPLMAMAKGPDREREKSGHDRPPAMLAAEQFQRVVRRLDLSDEQKLAIKGEFSEMRKDAKTLLEDMRVGQNALHDLISAEEYNPDAVSELADRQGALTADLIRMSAASVHAAMGHLTEAQLARLDELREERSRHLHRELEKLQKKIERLEASS